MDHSAAHLKPDENPNVLYTCPMHPEVTSKVPGHCPKCGMRLVPVAQENQSGMSHAHHDMKHDRATSRWESFKVSMTMTMGMEHSGIAGREMARMMELDIRRKFFIALILSMPIIVYSPVGTFLLGSQPPSPIPVP